MRLGAIDYHFRGQDDTARFFEARRMGLEGVEIMVTRAELFDPAEARLASLQRAQQASGIAVASLLLDEHNRARGIGFAEPQAVREALEDVRRAVRWSVALGAAVILLPFFETAQIVDEAAFERAAWGLRAICSEAASQGVDLCYEGTLPAAGIHRLAHEAGGQGFGCYFDTANVVFLGMDPATEIRALGQLIKQVHIKDIRHIPGDCRLGRGLVDFGAAAEALRETGFDGWLIGEYTEYPEAPGVPPPPPPEIVTQDISVTRRYFGNSVARAPWPTLGAGTANYAPQRVAQMASDFSAAGLSQVQLSGPLLEAVTSHPDVLSEVRSALAAHGLRLAAVDSQAALVSPDAKARAASRAAVSRGFQTAASFESSVLVARVGGLCDPDLNFPAPDSAQAWGLLQSALDDLLPEAVKYGVLLALHTGHSQLLRTEADLLRLLAAYPSKFLGLVADPDTLLTHHLMPAHQRLLTGYFDRFSHRFALASLSQAGPFGVSADPAVPGQGPLPVSLYLHMLQQRRPDLPLILKNPPGEQLSALARHLRNLAAAPGTNGER